MKRAYLIVITAVLLGLGMAVLSIPSVLANDRDNDGYRAVYAPNENVLGMSYGDWSAAWWQYLLLFTNDVSPYSDTTGQYCNEGQGGPVFFLVGGPANPTTRSCTIPKGKALFAPIINGECSSVEPGGFQGRNDQEARACAALWNDGTDIMHLKFTVDGVKVKNLGDFRVQSPFYYFNMVPPYNNFLGVDNATEGYSVSDGYWVMVKPLSPGTHVIHFEGAWVSGPGAGAVQNVTYNLTVTP
jgi:hypothetical protein